MKRSLFKRPAWAQPTSTSDSTNLFHRSDQTYVKVAAEEERRRKQRLANKEQKGTPATTTEGFEEGPGSKRRRLSVESDDDSENSDIDNRSDVEPPTKSKTLLSENDKEEPDIKTAVQPKESSPKSLAQRYDNAITENLSRMCETTIKAVKSKSIRQTRSDNVIDLDDSEDEPLYKFTRRQKHPSPDATIKKVTAPSTDDLLPSDDEFEELARAAREKARRKRLQEDIVQSPPVLSPNVEDGISALWSPSAHELTPPPQAPPANDPIVQILITSDLPNTNPLIVNRRTSQRLKDVRITWCSRQKFTPEMSSSVFLTWRGKRLFDVTTCKSLGIAADKEGNIRFKGSEDSFGEDERQIHMEVMNNEIFAEHKLKKQRKDRGDEEQQNPKEETEEATKAKLENSEPQVRVIVKARNFADFKLIIRPVRRVYLELSKIPG